MDTSKKIIVSACLAGEPCRYDGQSVPFEPAVELVRQGRALLVCPEQLGGLPTPRTPAEIVDGRVLDRDGNDVTHAFELGARKALDLAREAGCEEALLKSRSPSCGPDTVYDGTFSGRLIPGEGMFAALLRKNGVMVRAETCEE
ncbi:DUF523 domain-containing protein [Pseudodesulfovibrio tunisiensis]|uniref:DUF523 domain-containing protein n=1 Tax=Pseudodesulfovibrio tunisiensis TaxID=463192 RepID=UPI003C749647